MFFDIKNINNISFYYTELNNKENLITIIPARIYYGISEEYNVNQWFLVGFDIKNQQVKPFAMNKIRPLKTFKN